MGSSTKISLIYQSANGKCFTYVFLFVDCEDVEQYIGFTFEKGKVVTFGYSLDIEIINEMFAITLKGDEVI